MNPMLIRLRERRDSMVRMNEDLLTRAASEERDELAESEQTTFDEANVEIERLNRRIADLEQIEARNAVAQSMSVATNETLQRNGVMTEAVEQAVYRAGDEDAMVTDLLLRAQGDTEATERVVRSNRQNRNLLLRASGTSDLGGLIVPQYMVDDYAPVVRELRPFADSIGTRPLNAYTIIVPVATVGAASDIQETQNVAFATANVASSPLTLTASTAAGVVELSVQAVELGSLDGGSITRDIIEATAQIEDYELFHGSGGSGHVEGVFASDGLGSLDGTGADTFEEFYSAVVEAASKVRTGIKMPATHVCMSGSRWYSLMATLDSEGRPLLGWQGSAPTNVGGQWDGQTFAGLRVVVDDNIVETGEDDDKVIVYRASELRLFEQNRGVPSVIRVDQAKAAAGTVQFVGRVYFTFTAERRPLATTIISGLSEPSFPSPES